MKLNKEILEKYPNLCLKSKEDCLEYLKEKKDKMELKETEGFSADDKNESKEILSNNAIEEVYVGLGRFLSSQKTLFRNIYFREDCLEYLFNLGIKQNVTVEIMETIRKGTWKRYKNNVILPIEFTEWANGVKYLASRRSIFDGFELKY